MPDINKQKLLLLKEEPNLAFFDELEALNKGIEALQAVLSDINAKEVITYKEELSLLQDKLVGLTDALNGKDMVVNIPLDNLAEQIKRVEQAIKNIKEVKIPDFPKELNLNDAQINELLFAIQSIPEFPIDSLEKMVNELGKKIEAIKLEIPEQEKLDYEFLDDKFRELTKAVKNVSVSVSGGGGGIGERANNNLDNIATDIDSVISTNEYTSNKEVRIIDENHVCDDNSSTTPLGAGATFTGNWQDCLQYQEVNVSINTDQNSATDGLVIEWSTDGETACDSDVFSVYANAGTNYTPNPAFRYVRVKYTNGSVAQTAFNLLTILRRKSTGGSFHRITDTLKDDSDGRLNLSVLKLRTAQDDYVSGSATASGNFKVSIEEFDAAVSTNTNKLNTANYITDEYGNQSQVLGDNIFKGSIIAISPEHHEIHCGDSYEATYTGDLPNGASAVFSIIVPNEGLVETNPGDDQTAKQYHCKINIDTELESLITIAEGATLSNDGTPITIFNRNRNSSLDDFIGFNIDPTITTPGTTIFTKRIGSGRATGGSSGRENEFILKDNTKYTITILNATANNNYYNIELDYYVHPGI